MTLTENTEHTEVAQCPRWRVGRGMKRASVFLILALPVAVCATDLQSLCEKLSAKCQTCGKSAEERTAVAATPRDPAVERPVDEWERAVRVSVNNGKLRLQSAGADGTFDTADDVVAQCPMQ